MSQERVVLSREEVTRLIVGKVVDGTRYRDGARTRYDVRDDGYVWYDNYTNSFRDLGKWQLKDDGGWCVEWRHPSSTNGCIYFIKEGSETVKMSFGSPTAPASTELKSK